MGAWEVIVGAVEVAVSEAVFFVGVRLFFGEVIGVIATPARYGEGLLIEGYRSRSVVCDATGPHVGRE